MLPNIFRCIYLNPVTTRGRTTESTGQAPCDWKLFCADLNAKAAEKIIY